MNATWYNVVFYSESRNNNRVSLMKSTFFSLSKHSKASSFKTPEGAEEIYLTIKTEEETSFDQELISLHDSYMDAAEKCGLTEDTLIFSRFYLTDIANQKATLRESDIFKVLQDGAVSIIQQCPAFGGDVCLLVYHIKKDGTAFKKEVCTYDSENRRNGSIIYGSHYDLLWIANFYGIGPFDPYIQTTELFESFNTILAENGMTLLDNGIRTWVYVRDIDNHYSGMVEARKVFFERHGLNPDTRYLASTGIEGFSREVHSLVAFDAFAINNLKREQLVRMEALDNLPPTIRYGVTFDRGTRVRFGDRSHLHISGTASIDNTGDVMYLSDVRKQTQRAIENARALLAPHGADLKDLAFLIVYIRNIKDRNKVKEVLGNEIPQETPLLLLEGAVCRPAWLVEIEGIALIPDSNEYPDFI